MSAVQRVDPTTGVLERIEFVPARRGQLYTWLSHPPEPAGVVVICSSICADFTANYHRERALGHVLVERGLAVARFHYSGEGNSEGDPKSLTFGTLCEDAGAIVDHVRLEHGALPLALHGSRLGALVAAQLAGVTHAAGVSFWAPVASPPRFFAEAARVRRMSSMVRDATAAPVPWREELAAKGVLDLLGYHVYPPLVESLDAIDLASALGEPAPPTFTVHFRARADTAPGDANFALTESWWFHDETVQEAGELLASTAGWLAEVLRGGVGDD